MVIPGIADPLRFTLDFLAFFAIYLIFSISTNLDYGFAGIPDLGKVMFFAGGAFTVGALATRIGAYLANIRYKDFVHQNTLITCKVNEYLTMHPHDAILIFVATIAVGIIVSLILGYVASYPAIRLRVDYLGITLLVAGEIFRYIIKYYDPIVGGTYGAAVPDPFIWISSNIVIHDITEVSVMLVIAFIIWFYAERYANSPLCRMLRAARDNEIAAETFGKDIVKARKYVMMVSSAIAGIAGALYAFYVGGVHPDDYSTFRTFVIITVVTIGGVANNAGAAMGAFIYTLVDRLVRQYKYVFKVPFDLNYLASMLFAIALLFILIYRPDGIFPEKPSKTTNFKEIIDRLKKERR